MTTDPTRAAEIVVEQRHIDAAQDIYDTVPLFAMGHVKARPSHALVQAFARFERDHMQRPTDTARAGEADHWLNEARTQLRNGQAVLEKAERLEKALDSLTSWLLHRFGPDCPEGKEARTARKALLSVLPATPSPVTDEALTDEVQRLIAIAYAAGCQAVHDNYQEDRDPDFSEAASDYARSIDLAALASTPQPAVAETVERAVEAERERCAKIAENHFADERALGVVNALYMSTSIAAAIRQSGRAQ